MSKDRYPGVDEDTYHQILKNLRPFGSPPLLGDLPKEGEKVYPLVEGILSKAGWMRPDLKTRWISASSWISASRINQALMTGGTVKYFV